MDWIKICLSDKEIREIENAEKQIQKPQLLKRLQCIKLKNKGWKHKEISKFLGVCIDTITNWLKVFSQKGIQGLLQWDYKGKTSILTLEQQIKIIQRNKEKSFKTAKEVKDYIEKEFGIVWHLHWIQKLLKKNFACHIKKPH